LLESYGDFTGKRDHKTRTRSVRTYYIHNGRRVAMQSALYFKWEQRMNRPLWKKPFARETLFQAFGSDPYVWQWRELGNRVNALRRKNRGGTVLRINVWIRFAQCPSQSPKI